MVLNLYLKFWLHWSQQSIYLTLLGEKKISKFVSIYGTQSYIFYLIFHQNISWVKSNAINQTRCDLPMVRRDIFWTQKNCFLMKGKMSKPKEVQGETVSGLCCLWNPGCCPGWLKRATETYPSLAAGCNPIKILDFESKTSWHTNPLNYYNYAQLWQHGDRKFL